MINKIGQGFPAHKVAAVAAYRNRCQTKKRDTYARSGATHMTNTKRKLLSTLNVNDLSQVHGNKSLSLSLSLSHQNLFNASLSHPQLSFSSETPSKEPLPHAQVADPTDHVSTVPSPQPT